MKIKKIITILMISIITIFIVYSLYFDLKLNNIKNSKDIKIISKEKNSNLVINIKKGSEYASIEGVLNKFIVIPQMAIWIESIEGEYIKTIYVTPKFSKIKKDSILPVWNHINIKEVDTSSTPTPKSNLKIETVKPKLDKFNILLEINKSYDSNKYYNIGNEYNGQPSLIYIATIDNKNKTYKMTLYGHGSTLGSDGLIFKDLSGITTAKNILKEIVIVVKNK